MTYQDVSMGFQRCGAVTEAVKNRMAAWPQTSGQEVELMAGMPEVVQESGSRLRII